MAHWFAVVSPGLEPVLERELHDLGVTGKVVPGGVRFDAGIPEGVALVRRARTPTRVLLELAEGPCRSMDEVSALTRKVDWKKHLRPDAPVEVHATTKASRLHFKASVEGRVAHDVREALKGPRVVDREARARLPQRLQVRIEEDRGLVSLDAGGELLHFRGWRQEQGPAPLRENLAAALLVAAGWTGDEALVDPFCGSGTIPIEAALLATGRSPYGRGRRFAFEEWPAVAPKPGARGGARDAGGRGGERHGERGAGGRGGERPSGAREAVRPLTVPILGADRDARVLAAAEANARRAGVDVAWRRVDVADLEPPAPLGLLVANPPYGGRLGADARALENVWHAFGRTLRERFQGWRALYLAPYPGLATRVHPDAKRMLTFSNGGLKVGVWIVEQV